MMYWHWEASRENGPEDFTVCEICLESFWPVPLDSGKNTAEEHIREDHGLDPDVDYFKAESVFDIRQRLIVGYEYDRSSRDCDGPLYSSGSRRFHEMTWAQFVGQTLTLSLCEGITFDNDGLAFEYGGATEEGFSSTGYQAVFSHQTYKLDEPDTRRDVFAESMGY